MCLRAQRWSMTAVIAGEGSTMTKEKSFTKDPVLRLPELRST